MLREAIWIQLTANDCCVVSHFCAFVRLTIVISFSVSDGDQNLLLLTYQPEGKTMTQPISIEVLCFRLNFFEISRAVFFYF